MAPNSGRVFVVDDDAEFRALVGTWLRGAEYTAEEFADGADCLAALHERVPAAILLDLRLLGLQGEEILVRLRRRHRFLPVIIVTTTRDPETIVRLMQLGAYDYLTKPLDQQRLLTTVSRAVERHSTVVQLAKLEQEIDRQGIPGMIGASPPMRLLYQQIDRLTASDVSVLIHGESGTGKELVARAIHERSGRRDGPFVPLNCAAIPVTLQESELFGHERGAFTGATGQRRGCFEQADKGVLFLDEIAELDLSAQAKLLRALQTRQFQRVGGTRTISSDFRLLAATHRDLRAKIEAGSFREDLFFRIVVTEVEVPPLRGRSGDIVPLVEHFLRRYGPSIRGHVPKISSEAMTLLRQHTWPGNVRELENVMQRLLVNCSSDMIHVSDVVDGLRLNADESVTGGDAQTDFYRPLIDLLAGQRLEDIERLVVQSAVERHRGNLSQAATELGIARTTLYRKLQKCDPPAST